MMGDHQKVIGGLLTPSGHRRAARRQAAAILALATASGLSATVLAAPGPTVRASAGVNTQSDGHNGAPSISDTGRFVALHTAARNLVPGDTNGALDVVVRDVIDLVSFRISIRADGGQPTGDSFLPTISADGNRVAFVSEAPDITPPDANGVSDIFLRDRSAMATTRVSLSNDESPANGANTNPSIDAAGRYVVFESLATNLATDGNGHRDIFLRDTFLGMTSRISIGQGGGGGDEPNGPSSSASISRDGQWVAFVTEASNIVPGDIGPQADIALVELASGQVFRASADQSGLDANGAASEPVVSSGGQFVAFTSAASDLVALDLNGVPDIFVFSRATGQTERISVSSAELEASGASWSPRISADGRYVSFVSDADNLTMGDTNGTPDIYIRDRQLGTTSRLVLGPANLQAEGGLFSPAMSANGSYFTFVSEATNLVGVDTNGWDDILWRDRTQGVIAPILMVSQGYGGPNQGNAPSDRAALSGDGRWAAFVSEADTLWPHDTNGLPDVYVHDLQTSALHRVSVLYVLGPESRPVEVEPDGPVIGRPAISRDGAIVAFRSTAANLAPGNEATNSQVFVRDREALGGGWGGGTTRIASVDPSNSPAGFNTSVSPPSLSGDGQHVAFESTQTSLVTGDTNNAPDVFVRDLAVGVTTRVSTASDGGQSGAGGGEPAASADGRYIAFVSTGSDLVPGFGGSGVAQVFLKDRQTGLTSIISVRPPSAGGAQANSQCAAPAVSGDGRFVAFASIATNLGGADLNGAASDIYVKDRETGDLRRVSVSSARTQADQASWGASISEDGRLVGFISLATNLATPDTPGVAEAFVHDRATGQTQRVSVTTTNAPATLSVTDLAITITGGGSGGLRSLFSTADALIPSDTNAVSDAFAHDSGALGSAPCPADFDRSGSVASADITAFLTAWFNDLTTGTIYADFNLSGVTSSADITAFLAAWFDGLGGC
ncbi:MAG: PD40 domain-containing protein [Phycisphaerales bacterium]|nr:PD40 domain-containing protein [Phycisphaerales bacterium]